MQKKLYLSMLLLVACNSISAMEEAKQQVPAPAQKKLEIIRPSQCITQEEALPSTTVGSQPISQAITQRVEPRVVPVSVCSMRRAWPIREYIRVDATLVNYHTGDIRYYNEYHAQLESGTHIVSFPLNCCDPLPIRNFGSIRYFFTSAIEGGWNDTPGWRNPPPISITDPEINKIIAVRAKSEFYRSEVYIGYNTNSGVSMSGSRIYNGKILFITTKDTRFGRNSRFFNIQQIDIAGVGFLDMGQEARKYLQDPRDCSWNSPVFLRIINELMGPLEPGIVLQDQHLYSTICYWTKDENKLKGIHYGR